MFNTILFFNYMQDLHRKHVLLQHFYLLGKFNMTESEDLEKM